MKFNIILRLLLIFLLIFVGKSFAEETVSEDENGNDKRLVGGTKPKLGEIPYIVSMSYYMDSTKKFSKRICGGAILNKRWILTAAHCLENRTADDVYFKAGVIQSLSEDKNAMQLVHAKKLYRHPKFDNFKDWDIALVELQEELQFNQYVQPILLPEADAEPTEPDVLIMGYGASDKKNSAQLGSLKSAKNRLTPKDECWRNIFGYNNRHLCINHINVPDDSGICGGDSGSPVVQIRNGVAVVIGVNSFMQGVCTTGLSVFAHVSKYMTSFIEPVMNGKEPTI